MRSVVVTASGASTEKLGAPVVVVVASTFCAQCRLGHYVAHSSSLPSALVFSTCDVELHGLRTQCGHATRLGPRRWSRGAPLVSRRPRQNWNPTRGQQWTTNLGKTRMCWHTQCVLETQGPQQKRGGKTPVSNTHTTTKEREDGGRRQQSHRETD